METVRPLLPGIAFAAVLAALALAVRALPGMSLFSPLILAILIGMAFHNVIGQPEWARPGIAFCMRKLLRFAIILLGFQLTFAQVAAVGAQGIAIIVATLIASFAFTVWLGRRMNVERKLAELLAAGTAICGASAIIAANTVTRAPEEDAAYAVACVTVLGTIAMFLYPLLPAILGLDTHHYALWAGASIHEIAQVVGATFQHSQEAGEFGTIVKLSRVILLAPMVIALGWLAARRTHEEAHAKAPMPYFIFGFVAMMGVSSAVTVAPQTHDAIVTFTAFLFSISLAAMGLETDVGKLKAKGLRPFLLAAASWIFIAAFSLILVKLAAA